jgi:DNA-binding Lrp family transcriptional regulator
MPCSSGSDPLREPEPNGSLLRMAGLDDLDDIDRAIVAQLLAGARATFAQIGAQVGLSAPAVKRRVDRLVRTGTVSGFTAIIDPRALGWNTEAYVEIYCHGKVSPDRLRDRLSAIPEVLSACTVSGAPDALLHVLARDVQHLEETLQRIRDLDDVTSTKTEFVLSRLFQRTQ